MATARFGSTATGPLTWTPPQPIESTTFPLEGQIPVPPKPKPPKPQPPKPQPSKPPTPEPPVPVDPHPNLLATVEKWRVFYGNIPPGEERAWLITNGTAWDHRHEGAGILSKPSGTNHNGYSIDVVVFPDGLHYDCLVDGEGVAKPTWRLITTPPKVDPARWRAPIRPGTTPSPEPPAPPPPPPVPPTPAPPVSYGVFVGLEAQQVADKYRAVHGRNPAASDLYHNAWRRLVEGWSHQAILDDIR